MRKMVLIAAIAILSTDAYAGPSRGLSLATNEDPTLQPTQRADSRRRPQLLNRRHQRQRVPRHHRLTSPQNRPCRKKPPMTTEARVIYQLHRHGIYW